MSRIGWIGIDVGGTKTRVALFDSAFQLLESIKFKTPKEREDFTAELTDSVKTVIKKTGSRLSVSGIGVGFAGSVDTSKGVVQSAPNLAMLEGFSFKKALAKFGKGNVSLHNDVHAAMWGELKLGAAVGYKHVIGIFVGTGIGGAIVSDGKLYLGASGQAGNIGHYLLQPYGPLAGSERHGILDDVASRIAIAGAAATFAAKRWAPHLLEDAGTDVRHIRSSALAEAMRAGDDSVEELVRSRARIVGIVLSNMVDFFNPEMIVIGGGLTEAMPKIIREEVESGIKAHATAEAQKGLRVVTAKLKGHAVTSGAAKFASEKRGGRKYYG